MDFNFDEWCHLAQQDPAAFEAQRKKIIDQAIKESTWKNQRSLKDFQFHIDIERQKSKTPKEACIRLSRMVQEQFYTDFCPTIGRAGEWACPRGISGQKIKKGKVIPFRKQAEKKR